jgi:hypothetical protein
MLPSVHTWLGRMQEPSTLVIFGVRRLVAAFVHSASQRDSAVHPAITEQKS